MQSYKMLVGDREHPGDRYDARNFVAIERLYQDTGVIGRHVHRRAQLISAPSGVITISTTSRHWVIRAKTAVWLPAGIEHELRADGAVTMRSLFLEPSCSAEQAFPRESSAIQITPLLGELILRAVDLGADDVNAARLERLMAVVADEASNRYIAQPSLPMPSDKRIASICTSLLSKPAQDLTLPEWGSRVGASPRTLSRLFFAETGMTFGDWRQKVRIHASLSKLARGEPILSVSLDLGYESPSAFTAMFRRVMGVTPSQYLRSKVLG